MTPWKGDETPWKGDETPWKGDETPWKGDETPWKGDGICEFDVSFCKSEPKNSKVDLDFKGTEKVLNRVDLVAYVPKDSTASTMVAWSNPQQV